MPFDEIINLALLNTGLGTGTGPEIVGRLLARIFAAALGVGAIAFLLYLVLGAFRWLTAGDNKTQLESARSTIIQALIGLTILASVFAIARIVGLLLELQCGDAGQFPDVICWPTAPTPTPAPP